MTRWLTKTYFSGNPATMTDLENGKHYELKEISEERNREIEDAIHMDTLKSALRKKEQEVKELRELLKEKS